jgi:hypothetical protein
MHICHPLLVLRQPFKAGGRDWIMVLVVAQRLEGVDGGQNFSECKFCPFASLLALSLIRPTAE